MLRLLVFPLLALAAPLGHVMTGGGDRVEGLHLVIAPPWRDADALIAAAGGRVVGPLTAPLGRFAAADAPDFASRAAALGLVVLDAAPLSILCGTST